MPRPAPQIHLRHRLRRRPARSPTRRRRQARLHRRRGRADPRPAPAPRASARRWPRAEEAAAARPGRDRRRGRAPALRRPGAASRTSTAPAPPNWRWPARRHDRRRGAGALPRGAGCRPRWRPWPARSRPTPRLIVRAAPDAGRAAAGGAGPRPPRPCGFPGQILVKADPALPPAAFVLDWGDGRAAFDPAEAGRARRRGAAHARSPPKACTPNPCSPPTEARPMAEDDIAPTEPNRPGKLA